MNDTIECPYCGHENDMSDGLTDLPDDNKFDQECSACEEEFEVTVEFMPSYSSDKIVYTTCEKCGRKERDMCIKGRIFPYPDLLKETVVCRSCFRKATAEQFEAKRANQKNETESGQEGMHA